MKSFLNIARQSALTLFVFTFSALAVLAQTTAFTYQGRLNDASTAANGSYDLQFALYDAAAGGTQQSSIQTMTAVNVANGIFSVQLDFGSAPFAAGANRFLEIRVKKPTETNYTILAPRQRITSVPYAIRSLTAGTADNAASLNGQPAGQYVQTNDPRLSDARTPTAGSNFYIQNQGTAQQTANFNINGTGKANIFDAATQYNISGQRVLSTPGTDNLFAGVSAGRENNSGTGNTFIGSAAGLVNTTGYRNSFVGLNAGVSNTTGYYNAFFGYRAGSSNTTQNSNSFFGAEAGATNIANYNSFFGSNAGLNNTTGALNSFFGSNSGNSNTTAFGNTFIGSDAGGLTNVGGGNTFIGYYAGKTNISGLSNTLLGSSADVNAVNLTYATAIGAEAVVATNNTIVLGRPNGLDKVRIPGLGTAGATTLCRNANNEISTCSSSLRYKTNVAPFNFGLNLLNRLKPITFSWKDGGMADLGFGAEDVAAIEPLLVTYNKDGQVEGVKYDRIGVVLLNAVKEQQAQIAEQRQQLVEQKVLIDALRQLVCSQNQNAEVCKEK